MNLVSGKIVCTYRAFPACVQNHQWPIDIQPKYVRHLDENEEILGDGGSRIVDSLGTTNEKERKENLLRAYHEQFNGKSNIIALFHKVGDINYKIKYLHVYCS